MQIFLSKSPFFVLGMLFLLVSFSGCGEKKEENTLSPSTTPPVSTEEQQEKAEQSKSSWKNEYIPVTLQADLSALSEDEKAAMPIFFAIADKIDDLYWKQVFGDKKELFSKITDEDTKKWAEINYGPWNRLNGYSVLKEGFEERKPGVNFYPKDITKEEFEAFSDVEKMNPYTVLERDTEGKLTVKPYHEKYAMELKEISDLLKQAADVIKDPDFKKYLQLRADAILTDEYTESDFAWIDSKNNMVDFIVGPIEVYEDEFMGVKTAYESYILVKDKEWSERITKYAALLPELQKEIPVPPEYKTETPGMESDLGAYDVIHYSGRNNAGPRPIALFMPGNMDVIMEKGGRRLQLKNAMRAKFENILVPIADSFLVEDQKQYVSFDAFFQNGMVHEVAHGLGITKTIDGKGLVKDALKEVFSPIEEAKADELGLYFVNRLHNSGDLSGDIKENYVTFVSGIFRGIRFGTGNPYAQANILAFNSFLEDGAISEENGRYRVHFEKMPAAIEKLVAQILTLQGDGNYEGAKKFLEEKGVMPEHLKKTLTQFEEKKVPIDIVFHQDEIRAKAIEASKVAASAE